MGPRLLERLFQCWGCASRLHRPPPSSTPPTPPPHPPTHPLTVDSIVHWLTRKRCPPLPHPVFKPTAPPSSPHCPLYPPHTHSHTQLDTMLEQKRLPLHSKRATATVEEFVVDDHGRIASPSRTTARTSSYLSMGGGTRRDAPSRPMSSQGRPASSAGRPASFVGRASFATNGSFVSTGPGASAGAPGSTGGGAGTCGGGLTTRTSSETMSVMGNSLLPTVLSRGNLVSSRGSDEDEGQVGAQEVDGAGMWESPLSAPLSSTASGCSTALFEFSPPQITRPASLRRLEDFVMVTSDVTNEGGERVKRNVVFRCVRPRTRTHAHTHAVPLPTPQVHTKPDAPCSFHCACVRAEAFPSL
jgi:hypothetical protein